jgi:hypothetical protein
MPVLSIQRRRLLGRGYWVVATWPDGKRMDVVRFDYTFAAERWIRAEGDDWLAQNAAARAA